MENIKNFLSHVSPKPIRDILEEHLSEIIKSDIDKTISLVLDKRYAIGELSQSHEMSKLISSIKKLYGDDYSLSLKLSTSGIAHDREMLVPHTIHY